MNLEIITIILLVLSFAISAISLFMSYKNHKKYTDLTSGISGSNLEMVVKQFITQLEICTNDIAKMNKEFEKVRNETSKFFRKTGLVRYQAFEGTGGDQSFSLAMLDSNDNGFILSGIYGRDMSKVYAKEVIDGKVLKYKLTKEEEDALIKAKNQ